MQNEPQKQNRLRRSSVIGGAVVSILLVFAPPVGECVDGYCVCVIAKGVGLCVGWQQE